MANQTNALAVSQQQALTSPDAWKVMREQADMLVKSGLLPDSINKPEAAIAIMMTGAEFGFTPMQSFRLINVIKGKPTLTADGMTALVMQYCDRRGDGYLKVIESDNDHCTVEYRRPGEQDTHRVTFTIEDAKRAGLLGNPMWGKYPKNMCMARTKANACREGFPDVVGGVYDPDELMAPGSYTEAGGRVVAMNTLLRNEAGLQVPASAYSIDELQESGYQIAELTPGAAPARSDRPVGDDPDPYRLTAMRRLHAIGDAYGINHTMLHNYAVAKGKASLSDYENRELLDLANEIDITEIAPLQAMFGDLGWKAPQWMIHHAVVDELQPKVDQATGEILDVTLSPASFPIDPIEDEALRADAKQKLCYAARDEWEWSLDDLQAVATYSGDKPLSEFTVDEFRNLNAGLAEMTAAERAAELRSARDALGMVA